MQNIITPSGKQSERTTPLTRVKSSHSFGANAEAGLSHIVGRSDMPSASFKTLGCNPQETIASDKRYMSASRKRGGKNRSGRMYQQLAMIPASETANNSCSMRFIKRCYDVVTSSAVVTYNPASKQLQHTTLTSTFAFFKKLIFQELRIAYIEIILFEAVSSVSINF